MEEEHDELTSEIHDLRSLNQALRVDLERFQDVRHVALHLVRLLSRPVRRRARGIAARVIRPRGRSDDYHASFRSYRARPAPPRNGGRARVLHAIGNFVTGGSARLVVDLIEQLGSDYEQRVIIATPPPVRGYEGVMLQEYPNLTSTRPLRRLFRQFRPDIVHIHYVADQRKSWDDLYYRWYIHVFDAAAQAGSTIIENVNILTEPYRSEAVDRYVYVSDHVRRRYARDGDRATVIHPGSDLTRFRRPPGLERPPHTLGLVYRLQRDKLDETSIDPIIDVLRRREAARAIVIGGGELLPVYQHAAAESEVSDRVTFTGFVSYADLPRWYGQMTAFVAPVHTESFGHVSVFAMGMELPVAGYDVGALAEILGNSELLAAPGDARGLADILIRLLDDPEGARKIGASNRRRAEQNFSVERMVAAYRATYEELARNPDRRS
jgi:glycosyltransferase involved in cell wall biosynthesis